MYDSGFRLGAVVFITGAAALATEIAAARLVAPYFGSSTAVWANVIGLILLFLALGYFLGGRLADRHPQPALLALLVAVAAACVAATPFLARPILRSSLDAFDSVSIVTVVGSFFGVLALFAVPVTLLGAVSPFAIRLRLVDVAEAGTVAGRLYALSTAGSIFGTFASALVGIPFLGTQRTLELTAIALAATAPLLLGRRWLAVPAAAALLLIIPAGAVKAGTNVIYETESPYQYIRVVDDGDGWRALELNEGVARHSVWRHGDVLTGGYWDLFLVVPRLLARSPREVLVIGNSGGTIARALGRFYPDASIDGIEIDAEVSDVGRRYFGLGDNRRLHVVTADGRVFLELTRKRYDLIVVDAYRQPYIPFHLATREFFELAREHLEPGGMLALNVAAGPGGGGLSRAIGSTVLAGFPQAWRWRAMRYNHVVLGLTAPATRGALLSRARHLPRAVRPLLPLLERRLERVRAEAEPLTDDRAPVEWLTDELVLAQIRRGGVDEDVLPTEP
jgi:predicted membrane-bound spermidine synthase